MIEGLAIGFPPSHEVIVEAFWRYLQSLDRFDTELEATEENAKAFAAAHFFEAWERKEPILIAVMDDRIVGATFTTLAAPGLEYRVPFAYGHGTWVREGYRNRGIARALIEAVREMLRARGIKRQLGMAHIGNDASLEAFTKMGFHLHAQVLRYDL